MESGFGVAFAKAVSGIGSQGKPRSLRRPSGGPVNLDWADRIGADGYGKSAIDAVALVKGLMDKRRSK
jgi:hypothetical protein